MGLASFNRMRIRQVEEMKPENIQKRQEDKKIEITKEEMQEMPSKRKAKREEE